MLEAKCGFNSNPESSGASLLTRFGPSILVDIGFDAAFKVQTPPALPVPGIKGLHALVDTGAGECCIDNLLASQLKLPIVDRRPVSGAHGSHLTNMYLAQIHIPSLMSTIYGMFAGVDLLAGGQVHYALIGRTFLQNFTMVYEGKTGTVTISS